MTTKLLTNGIDVYDATSTENVVYALDGNDVIDTLGQTTNYTIYGGEGNDAIRGYNGNDYLSGGRGNDVLVGWGGNDTEEGGLGHDQFWFDYSLGDSGVDKILDFTPGQDLFGFDTDRFAGLGSTGTLAAKKFYEGAQAHDASDRVIYDPTSGKLLYDSNGNHSGGEVTVAKLTKHLHLTHNDVIVGDIDYLFL